MERWVGKTAVVTGASAGIGAAISLRLANEGLRVVGLDRREELVQKLQDQVTGRGEICAMRCDVGKPEEVAAAFERVEEFGGVDLLVNNAALLPSGHITEALSDPLKDAQVHQMINVNITGYVLCSRHAVASMKKRGVEGHIVVINSVGGHYIPSIPVANLYPMTKHAVTAFCTALNDELAHAKAKIKITSLSPGLVDTDMGRLVSEDVAGAEAYSATPKLRTKDVVDALVYVVSTPPNVNILELTISALNEIRH
ncbi:farnesol dehydrogenase-like [Leguminivora glycinivorella]|uniref:farnesol dehydrogenase-like n=1 Tax=Leguminivora glycinivorella TaxID=1035111 RepID=UPI00200E66B0|nr:farnesol dehydrogenase-like [Leguminivora glycinivorella]